MTVKRKIGIMGGTFDPIHLGHLFIAEAAREQFELERVLFIPAAVPPHKQALEISSARHRYLMTVLAVESHPQFFVSDLEIRRSGPSYAVDTMETLVEEFGDAAQLFFITGADALCGLPTWRNPERLLEICRFIAASRPGCNDLERVKSGFGKAGKERIHTLTTPELEISATDIRQRVACGKSIRYMVPEAVEHYIRKEGLYR